MGSPGSLSDRRPGTGGKDHTPVSQGPGVEDPPRLFEGVGGVAQLTQPCTYVHYVYYNNKRNGE